MLPLLHLMGWNCNNKPIAAAAKSISQRKRRRRRRQTSALPVLFISINPPLQFATMRLILLLKARLLARLILPSLNLQLQTTCRLIAPFQAVFIKIDTS